MAVTETMSLILTVGDAFVSSTGKKFVKGEIYTLPKEEAIKLLATKGDYDVRFFKPHAGEAGKAAAPVDLEKKAVLPTPEEVAASMLKENQERNAAVIAAEKADALATATRGQGDVVLEQQIEATKAAVAAVNNTGEIDTATTEAPTRTVGRPRGATSKAVPA